MKNFYVDDHLKSVESEEYPVDLTKSSKEWRESALQVDSIDKVY